jgi:hypothetical protein
LQRLPLLPPECSRRFILSRTRKLAPNGPLRRIHAQVHRGRTGPGLQLPGCPT